MTVCLSAEFKAEQQRKRERRKRQPVLRQPGERAEKIREFASSIGWDIGETEVGLLLAGQRIALDGVFYVARSDGALYRTRVACSKSNMTTINTWLGRLGASYRYRPNRET